MIQDLPQAVSVGTMGSSSQMPVSINVRDQGI